MVKKVEENIQKMHMMNLTNKISSLIVTGLLLINLCYSQEASQDRMPKIQDIQGIWQMKFEKYQEDYIIIKNNKQLNISYSSDDNYGYSSTEPHGYIGLLNDRNSIPTNIKNLDNEGMYALQYDYPTDQNGNFQDKSPLVRQFTYNGSGTDGEMSKEEGEPNFIGFVNGRGQWEIYKQIPYIPTHVLVALKKNNPKDYEFLIKFLDIDFKTITVQKSIIHSAPNQPTKMYLIKGDEVACLEEKGEWYKIRYYGKKTIEGWISKSDVE